MWRPGIGLRWMLHDLRTLGPQFAFLRWRPRRNGKVVVNLPGYPPMHLRPSSSDASVIREIFERKEYSLDGTLHHSAIMRRYDELVAAGETPLIIDAGANIGAASIWFAKLFPRAKIVAIEPEPENADCCRLNTSQLPQVSVLEAALGSAPGNVHLNNPWEAHWAFRSERADEGIRVVTIPEVVAAHPEAKLFLLKIDIEGFESDLFSQNVDWIDDADVLIVEVHDWMQPGSGLSATLQRAMAPREFDMLLRGENLVFVNRSRVGFEPAP
jgi:FkbM family methyltransferase